MFLFSMRKFRSHRAIAIVNDRLNFGSADNQNLGKGIFFQFITNIVEIKTNVIKLLMFLLFIPYCYECYKILFLPILLCFFVLKVYSNIIVTEYPVDFLFTSSTKSQILL